MSRFWSAMNENTYLDHPLPSLMPGVLQRDLSGLRTIARLAESPETTIRDEVSDSPPSIWNLD
jgi:hypothetical protein